MKYRLLLCFLCMQLSAAFSQQVTFSYQQGLSTPVKKIVPITGTNILIVADGSGSIVAWNILTNKILCRINGTGKELHDVIYVEAEKKLLTAGENGIDVFDAAPLPTKEALTHITHYKGTKDYYTALSWNSSQKTLRVLSSDGTVFTFQSIQALEQQKKPLLFSTGISGAFAMQEIGNRLCVLGIHRQAFFTPEGKPIFSIDNYATIMYGYTFSNRDSCIYVPREGNIIKLSYRNNRFAASVITLENQKKGALVYALFADSETGHLYVGTNYNKLFVINSGTKRPTAIYEQPNTSFTGMYRMGKLLLAGDFFGNVTAIDTEKFHKQFELTEDLTPTLNGVYLQNNRRMITTHFGVRGFALKIWDIPTASLLQSFNINGNITYDVGFSKNGDTIYSGHTDKAIYRYYKTGGRYQMDTLQAPITPFIPGSILFNTTVDKKSIRSKNEERFHNMLKKPGLSYFPADTDNTITIAFADSLLPDAGKELPNYHISNAFLTAAGLAPDTRDWDIMNNDIFYIRARSSDSLPMFLQRVKDMGVDTAKAALYYRMVKGSERPPSFTSLYESGSTRELFTLFYKQKPLYADLELMPQTALFFFPDSLVVWDGEKQTVKRYYTGKQDMDLYYDYNPWYVAIADAATGTVSVFNRGSEKAATQWISFGRDDYLVHSQQGYFKTKGRSNRINFSIDRTPLSFSSFDLQYNRPDLVLQEIGAADSSLMAAYQSASFKRLKKNGVQQPANNRISQPWADFTNRSAIAYNQPEETLTLHLAGKDSLFPLDRFNIWINEAPIFGQNGFRIRNTNKRELDTTITITLSAGENRIETAVTNIYGTESFRTPLIVTHTPQEPVSATTYFIGIGINRFQQPGHNLQWCVKDIRDLAISLKEKLGNSLIIDTLFDEQVVVAQVKRLKERLMKTSVNDKVVIAYSGHGLLSKNYDYYLSAFDVNFKRPEENGIPYQLLEDLLDSIPARKKLLLLDACHSGEVDKEDIRLAEKERSAGNATGLVVYRGSEEEESNQTLGLEYSFELMQSLFVNVGKSTGTLVIAAAGGVQFAQERGDLKNGVFTFSLLELLKKYPTLKVSQLQEGIRERVLQLTNGMQQPTARSELKQVDWELW